MGRRVHSLLIASLLIATIGSSIVPGFLSGNALMDSSDYDLATAEPLLGVPSAGGLESSRVVIGFHEGIPDPHPIYVQESGGEVVLEESALRFIVVSVEPERNTQLISAARGDTRVEYAEFDSYVTTQHTPNDNLWNLQWGSKAINLPDAWDITFGSHDVHVHILDTGIDYMHADLLPNLSPVCDSPTSVGWSTIGAGKPGGKESGFHGTHVAGIAGAVMDNTIGVAGASQSCLTSVQVLAVEAGFDTWVAAGIRWSADNGADVISMSLSGPNPTGALGSAVRYAEARGVLLVAAAGNDGCAGGSGNVGYPAAYDEVMATASLASQAGRSSFSSCGPQVEISAPGSNIWSTLPGNTYAFLSGTSMATPYVSGVAGLVWAANATLTHTEVRCILTATAHDLGSSGHNNQFGWGRLDASKAVTVALDPIEAVKDFSVLDTSRGVCPAGIFEEEATGPLFDPGHAYVDVQNTGVFNEDVDLPIPAEVIANGSFVVENATHGLVIPPSVGQIDAKMVELRSGDTGHLIIGTDLSAAGDIHLQGGYLLDVDAVQVTAGDRLEMFTEGDLSATDSWLYAESTLRVQAEDDVGLEDATATSGNGRIFITAGNDLYGKMAFMEGHDQVRVKTGNNLEISGAHLTSHAGNVRLDAAGTMSF